MAPLRKRKNVDNKIDALLRQGAANKKVNIDKALVNSNDRLLKEKIVFTKAADTFNSVNEFTDSQLIILDSSKEAAAKIRTDLILAEKASCQFRGSSSQKKKTKKKSKESDDSEN